MCCVDAVMICLVKDFETFLQKIMMDDKKGGF